VLKFAFKKMAKKNDFIRMEELGDTFRHAGQNPPEDVIKDMVEKAKAMKNSTQTHLDNERESRRFIRR
jgi:Ca2+-binding EF-hand superfamily protein